MAERDRAQAAVTAEARRVEDLSGQIAAASGEEHLRLEELLELARARQGLAQDALDEAMERLGRAGGDPQARIQRLRAIYEAGQKEPAALPVVVSTASASDEENLLARIRVGPRRGAGAHSSRRLGRRRSTELSGLRIPPRGSPRECRMPRRPWRRRRRQRGLSPRGRNWAPRRSRRCWNRSRAQLTGPPAAHLDGKRLQDHQELAEVYADWVTILEGEVRTALHQTLRMVAWLLLAIGGVLLAGALVERFFPGAVEEGGGKGRLRTVVRLAVQAAGLVAVIFIALGLPAQATTILGLAGAGLTVAMKDFIVAFFGWFILMGRNGIRVGDWVEIEGVGGEVAELGILHTVLLETGSWTDAGHPTGRRVSFVNSFAIEGHYFNFTTSGQWMWDELRVLVPPGQDPYPILDGVQKLVEHDTQANAQLAEQEWRTTTSRYRVRTFSAVPGVSVVPTAAGVELDVRYITRAYERHATRRRLNHAVVDLMHGKRSERAAEG